MELRDVVQTLTLVRSRSAASPGRTNQAYEEHVAIFQALKQGNSREAARAMRLHIHNGKLNILRAGEDE
jgi:DNA-binding GntR family transcriptional regulator